MKTLEILYSEKNKLIIDFESGMINLKKSAFNKKRDLIDVAINYVKGNPREEFIKNTIDKLNNKLHKIDEAFYLNYAHVKDEKVLKKIKSNHNSTHGRAALVRQISFLKYLLK